SRAAPPWGRRGGARTDRSTPRHPPALSPSGSPSGVEVRRVLGAERALAGVLVHRHRPGAGRLAARAAPDAPLRAGEEGAAAGGADPLVVGDVAGDLVAVAEPALGLDEVPHLHAGGEGVPAAAAERPLPVRPHLLVEPHRELRGALEDVEEL